MGRRESIISNGFNADSIEAPLFGNIGVLELSAESEQDVNNPDNHKHMQRVIVGKPDAALPQFLSKPCRHINEIRRGCDDKPYPRAKH